MKLKMLTVLSLTTLLVTGCATNSDVKAIESQINELKLSVAQVSVDAQSAQASSAEALAKSSAAEEAANRAELFAKETNDKLNNVFKNAMLK